MPDPETMTVEELRPLCIAELGRSTIWGSACRDACLYALANGVIPEPGTQTAAAWARLHGPAAAHDSGKCTASMAPTPAAAEAAPAETAPAADVAGQIAALIASRLAPVIGADAAAEAGREAAAAAMAAVSGRVMAALFGAAV